MFIVDKLSCFTLPWSKPFIFLICMLCFDGLNAIVMFYATLCYEMEGDVYYFQKDSLANILESL